MRYLAWAVAPPPGINVVSTDIAHPNTTYPWMQVSRHMNCEVRWAFNFVSNWADLIYSYMLKDINAAQKRLDG